jgi:hypothetical protein
MIINHPKRIEDYILLHLKDEPVLMLDLVGKIQQDRPKTTKQAVYAALRVLKKNEQIVTYKGTAALNLTWLNAMADYFDLAKHNYSEGNFEQGNFIDLADKEKIKYHFQSAVKADIFWTHALFLLVEKAKSGEPVFIYNPHEWFLLARNENESQVFKTINQKNHAVLLTSGKATFLDRHVRKYFDNDLSQYNLKEKPLFEKNNYYLNIIGDFLIEVWLDEKIADKVEEIYQQTISWDDAVVEKLKNILALEKKMKIVISRNKKKADKIKRSLKNDFVIKALPDNVG